MGKINFGIEEKSFVRPLRFKNKTVNKAKKGGSYIIKLLKSYFLIIITLIMIIFIVGSFYFNKVIIAESVENNNKLLQQFGVMADDYILGNLKDISSRIYLDCQQEYYLYKYMTETPEDNVVDTLKVQTYLSDMLYMNPFIESLALYYPETELVVTNYVIRYSRTEDMYMGDLLQNMSELSQFDDQYKWLAESDVNIAQELTSDFDAIHFIRKIPSVGTAGETGCILFITINEDLLYEMLQSSAQEDYEQLIIIDSEGVIASHTEDDMIGKTAEDLDYYQWISEATDVVTDNIVTINDVSSVLSIYKSEQTDWIYISTAPIKELSKLRAMILQMIAITVCIASLIAFIMSLIYAKRLYNPIERLIDVCAMLTPTMGKGRVNEFQVINSTIDTLQMQVNRQKISTERSYNILKQAYMRDLFMGEGVPPQPVSSWLESISIPFEHESACALLVKVRSYDERKQESVERYAKLMSCYIENALRTDNSSVVSTSYNNIIMLIVNFNKNNMDLENIREVIESYGKKSDGIDKFIFFGNSLSTGEVHKSAMQARKTANYHFLFPDTACLYYKDIQTREDTDEQLSTESQKKLELNIKTFNYQKALDSVDSIIFELKQAKCSISHVKWMLRITAKIIQDTALNAGIDLGDDYENLIGILELVEDIEEFRMVLISILEQYFSSYEQQHNERNFILVSKAKDYIMENISDSQLSLRNVADFAGVSSSHFSRIFKKETGISFLDYITDYKLDYSKTMLSDTDKKIKDISAELGYSTPQYFSYRFRAKFGCTPHEFRLNSKTI